MMLLSNKAQLEAMEAMSGLETARLRGTAASQGAEEVLSRLSRPMESSDNIRPRKGSKQVYRYTGAQKPQEKLVYNLDIG